MQINCITAGYGNLNKMNKANFRQTSTSFGASYLKNAALRDLDDVLNIAREECESTISHGKSYLKAEALKNLADEHVTNRIDKNLTDTYNKSK